MHRQRIRVGVLFGGRSSEHDVSVQSARSVLAAIDREKYQPVPIKITRTGEWLALERPSLADPTRATSRHGARVAFLPAPGRSRLLPLPEASAGARALAPAPLDVVFPLLHGPLGEDGTVQGLLELADIPYVGSGVLGSAVGMDKAFTKTLCAAAGLPVGPYRVVIRHQWRESPDAIRRDLESRLAYPWFVKPANLGSSIGVSRVDGPHDLSLAMEAAAEHDAKILVEAAIEDAREIEIGVLGNAEPLASVPGEVISERAFYDYHAKYQDPGTRMAVPADLPPRFAQRLRGLARRAFRALDCTGLARVDMLVRRADHAVFVSEVNTMPGFTSMSMFPRLWEASGIAYPELVDRLIQLAFERHRERSQGGTGGSHGSDRPGVASAERLAG